MPKTVCITFSLKQNGAAGSLYNFFGHGHGYEYHSSEVSVLATGSDEVLAFSRGCSDDATVLVVANFNNTAPKSATLATPWLQGTRLVDAIPRETATEVVVGAGGGVSLTLPRAGSLCLVPSPVRRLPKSII